jgi:hypothetical protein
MERYSVLVPCSNEYPETSPEQFEAWAGLFRETIAVGIQNHVREAYGRLVEVRVFLCLPENFSTRLKAAPVLLTPDQLLAWIEQSQYDQHEWDPGRDPRPFEIAESVSARAGQLLLDAHDAAWMDI